MSIGEIAHSTGVSRRMLRHWEGEGLLTPATTDPVTGYRRYQDSQLGRVRAIMELRALGFGLAEIGQLLDPRIEQSTLEVLLTHQVDALQRQITEASTRLVHVQHRLDIIQSKSMEGTGARVGDSRLHAASAGVWSMINSYSTGVNRPRRTCRRRRW